MAAAYSQLIHRQVWLQQSDPEIRIHYVEAKPTSTHKGTILLIHGFPESSYQFRHVMGPLSSAGYRTIAPDYRGAGYSSRPVTGYTKKVLATDLHDLLTQHLSITDPVHVIGHDIGGMVAHAYAALFPEDVASLIWGECPLPGTTIYDDWKHTPALWHFNFHSVPDLPELLVTGHEKQYLKHFYDRLGQNPAAFTEADLDFYATLYSAPGAMRAGFNVYRTFEEDKVDNQGWLQEKGKVKVRAMILGGEQTLEALRSESMAKEVNETVVAGVVEGSGHWIAEENPQDFVKKVLGFIEG
ncbi:MAG: hypothetical protein L6R40_005656 [Gallowayella cf. fulva]|nr:MAG: hypothetical protein L6R40_005656 [Xanthomendoza cf. fulva]